MKRPICGRLDCTSPVDFIVHLEFEGGGCAIWHPGICKEDQEWLRGIIKEFRKLDCGVMMPPVASYDLLEWSTWHKAIVAGYN